MGASRNGEALTAGTQRSVVVIDVWLSENGLHVSVGEAHVAQQSNAMIVPFQAEEQYVYRVIDSRITIKNHRHLPVRLLPIWSKNNEKHPLPVTNCVTLWFQSTAGCSQSWPVKAFNEEDKSRLAIYRIGG